MVSIVMPTYNCATFIGEAVQSVFSQSYTELELIVVDDGSSDETRAILRQLAIDHGARMRVLQQSNQGPYPARNHGLKVARGEYIAFLDGDDYWSPRFIEKLVAALQRQQADVAYCGWQNVGLKQHTHAPYIPPCYEEGDLARGFLKASPWPIHAVILRHSVIAAVNGFSERWFASMDYDLWLRVLPVSSKLVRVPEVLAYYRWHNEGQISSNKWKQILIQYEIHRDFVAANPELVRHILADELQRLTQGYLLENAYTAFWQRDLEGSRELFRKSLAVGCWGASDLGHIAVSLLPLNLYRRLIKFVDRFSANTNR